MDLRAERIHGCANGGPAPSEVFAKNAAGAPELGLVVVEVGRSRVTKQLDSATKAIQMRTFSEFLQDYPDYAATSVLDDLRTGEFACLDESGQVYLDYTGSGLYAASQLREHIELLDRHVFGNPHSASRS